MKKMPEYGRLSKEFKKSKWVIRLVVDSTELNFAFV